MVHLFKTHDVMIYIVDENGNEEEVGFDIIDGHDDYVITLEEAERLLKSLQKAIKQLKENRRGKHEKSIFKNWQFGGF